MFENIVLFDNYVIIIYTFFPILVGDEDNNNDNDDDDDDDNNNNNNNKTNKNNNKSIRRKAIPRCAYQLVWVSVWSGFVSGRPSARSKACFQSTNERVFQLFIRRFSIHNSSKKKKKTKKKCFLKIVEEDWQEDRKTGKTPRQERGPKNELEMTFENGKCLLLLLLLIKRCSKFFTNMHLSCYDSALINYNVIITIFITYFHHPLNTNVHFSNISSFS